MGVTRMKRGKSKRFFVLLSILFLLLAMAVIFSTKTGASANLPAGWFQQTSGTLANLKAMSAVDNNTAWVAGDGAQVAVLRTTDGGDNWSVNSLPPEIIQVWSISAVDADVAFLVGSPDPPSGSPYRVWKTNNGGIDWTPLDTGTSKSIHGVFAVDANTVWAVGQAGTIVETTNGGASWTTQVSPTDDSLNEVYAVNANVAWAGGYGATIKTEDGGATWKNLPSMLSLTSISALDDQTAYGAGPSSNVQKTSDGGVTWTEQTKGGYFWAIDAVSTTAAWAVGSDTPGGKIAATTDGINWFSQYSFPNTRLNAVGAVDADTAWAVGDGGVILKTVDGGGSPQAPEVASISPSSGADLETINIVGSYLGLGQGSSYVSFGAANATQYIAWADSYITCKVPALPPGPVEVKVHVLGNASNGVAFNVIEAPASGWHYQDSGTSNQLNAVEAVDADTAWVVGDKGIILKTINGGANWNAQDSGVTSQILDLSVASSDIAFAVAGNTLLKTIDGGATWKQQNIDGSLIVNVRKVTAADANNVWVAGSSTGAQGVALLKSNDGGSNWAVQNTGLRYPSSFSVNELLATDANNIWAVGGMGNMDFSQGFVIYSVNSGANWNISYYGPIFWYDVSSVGTQNIWIIGNQYFYYPYINRSVCSRTSDGGPNWSDVPLDTSRPRMIEAVDSNTLWTVENGRIRKTLDGGNNWSLQTDLVEIMNDLSVFNKDMAWAVGRYGGILHTTGGGVGAAPMVSSVTPTEGSQLSFGTSITIEGSGYMPGAGVRLEKGGIVGNDIDVNVVSDSQITCSVFLFGSEPGAYDVVVKNPDGQEAKLAGGFTVTSQCGSGSGAGVLALGLTLGLLSLAGCGSFRKRRRVKG
jgi:photosystem II stability/assembly factor-like uncharacterized protein